MSIELQRSDFVWGAASIAEEIGVGLRQAFYLLESKQIPARKVGSKWVAERNKLRAHLSSEEPTEQTM
jgi:hypothetical protein